MPSIKYFTDKHGLVSAKIQAYCKDINDETKKVYFYKHVYNEKNIPIEKFKKNVERIAIQFETEQSLKYAEECERKTQEVKEQLQRIEDIKEIIEEKMSNNRVLTFSELANEWLEHVLKDYSVGYYSRGLRAIELFNIFLKEKNLYEKPISEIKVRDIQMFLNRFPGQSPATVRGHKRILHVVFEDAVRYEWINRNPVDGVKVSAADSNLRPIEEKEVLSMQEAKEFVETLDNFNIEKRPLRAAFKIMLFAGLRSGEMYGLRWSDIDLERKVLHVKRNRLYNKFNNQYYEKCPKTPTSLRDIPIPDILYNDLIDYKEWYKEVATDLDDNLDKYYVLCNLKRKPASCRALQDGIKEMRNKKQVKKHITCHGLRHTYCSLLLAQSIPIQTVTRYMGHSNSTVTLRVYTHFIPDTQQIFLDTINKAFS